MKWRILIMLFMISVASYSLEVYRSSDLNFGEVVRGDRAVTLNNVKVYVRGEANRKVKVDVPKEVSTRAGIIRFYPREEIIRLNNNGRGYFTMKCKLTPRYSSYGDIRDTISFRVKYD